MEYDGQLVSQLGVKKYLQGVQAQKTSNLRILERQSYYQKSWGECNFGCHGPTYRVMKREATLSDFIRQIDKNFPLTASMVDGMHTSTIKQVELLGAGIERTGEGLGLQGNKKFRMVGTENMAVLKLMSSIFKKVLDSDIDFVDNPLTKLIMAIIYEYIGLIPESLLVEMLKKNALKIPDGIDENFIYAMMAKGIVSNVDQADIKSAAKLLKSPTEKLIAKQVGKKLGVAIATVIASKITKKLMRSLDTTWRFKKRIASMRKISKSGGAGTLITLLKTQGWIGIAVDSSRKLKMSCPKLWNFLRNDLNGADLLFFLVSELTKEYVDRISLIEKSPTTYLKLMQSLVREGNTKEIFFPK